MEKLLELALTLNRLTSRLNTDDELELLVGVLSLTLQKECWPMMKLELLDFLAMMSISEPDAIWLESYWNTALTLQAMMILLSLWPGPYLLNALQKQLRNGPYGVFSSCSLILLFDAFISEFSWAALWSTCCWVFFVGSCAGAQLLNWPSHASIGCDEYSLSWFYAVKVCCWNSQAESWVGDLWPSHALLLLWLW